MADFIPITFVMLLYVPIAYFMTRTFSPQERISILKIVTIALLVRLAVALFIVLFVPRGLFGPDALVYMADGMKLSDYWSGLLDSPKFFKFRFDGTNQGYYYFVAWQYYIFGKIQYFPSYVNALVGTISIFLIIKIAHQYFAWKVVRNIALFVAFFPSLILFNSYPLKDTLVYTLSLISLYHYIQFLNNRNWLSIFVSALVMVPLYTIRFYMVIFLLGVFFLTGFLLAGELSLKRIARSAMAGIIVFILAFALGVGGDAMDVVQSQGTVERANFYQQANKEGGSAVFEGQEYKTGWDIVRYLPIRVVHFLFAPFPWQITSLVSLMAFLELPFWWYLFPSTMRGFKFLLVNRRARIFMPFLVYSVFVTLLYAVLESNIGTFYRKKAQVLPLFFFMAGVGLAVQQAQKSGLPLKYILAPNQRDGEAGAIKKS